MPPPSPQTPVAPQAGLLPGNPRPQPLWTAWMVALPAHGDISPGRRALTSHPTWANSRMRQLSLNSIGGPGGAAVGTVDDHVGVVLDDQPAARAARGVGGPGDLGARGAVEDEVAVA